MKRPMAVAVCAEVPPNMLDDQPALRAALARHVPDGYLLDERGALRTSLDHDPLLGINKGHVEGIAWQVEQESSR